MLSGDARLHRSRRITTWDDGTFLASCMDDDDDDEDEGDMMMMTTTMMMTVMMVMMMMTMMTMMSKQMEQVHLCYAGVNPTPLKP